LYCRQLAIDFYRVPESNRGKEIPYGNSRAARYPPWGEGGCMSVPHLLRSPLPQPRPDAATAPLDTTLRELLTLADSLISALGELIRDNSEASRLQALVAETIQAAMALTRQDK
jgi:hypothetical protein